MKNFEQRAVETQGEAFEKMDNIIFEKQEEELSEFIEKLDDNIEEIREDIIGICPDINLV